jgi:hypothetical protein
MIYDKTKENFSFKKAAVYRILVKGKIDKSWSDRLSYMQINIEQQPRGKTFTSLIGKINDQTGLSSVLLTLYEMNVTVISVKMLSEID